MKKQNYCYDNSFFCLNCGEKNVVIPRKKGHQHTSGHRKALYCPWCKNEVNHIECKTPEDVIEFRANFKEGVYKDEAANSISFMRAQWKW